VQLSLKLNPQPLSYKGRGARIKASLRVGERFTRGVPIPLFPFPFSLSPFPLLVNIEADYIHHVEDLNLISRFNETQASKITFDN
jgi:hypothetical protein